MSRRNTLTLICIVPPLMGVLAAPLLAAWLLCKSANHSVPLPSGFRPERLFLHGHGKETAAWYLPGTTRKAIILAHGIDSDRNALVPRAQWLCSLGYSIVLVDLHAHGETQGERKTFGMLEAKDIANAFAFLRDQKSAGWIGGLGTSLGGASLLKAAADGVAFDALVLEAVFADIRSAARHRLELRFGRLGRMLEPMLTAQLHFWAGYSRVDLRPADWARKYAGPALLLVGSADERAKVWESEAILANLAGTEKRLVAVPGAGHVDLHAFMPGNYRREVGEFLESSAQQSRHDHSIEPSCNPKRAVP